MALQTKTFTAGKSSWDNTYKGFVLTLELTENSTSEENNTSNISYSLVLSNPGHYYDLWSQSGKYNVEVSLGAFVGTDNVALCIGRDPSQPSIDPDNNPDGIELDIKWSQTLISGTVDVPHNDDGTLAMIVKASLETIAGGVSLSIDNSWKLTDIDRTTIFTNTIYHVKDRKSVV